MSNILLSINPDAGIALNDSTATTVTIKETVEQISKMDFNEVWSQLLSSAVDIGLKI